MIFLFNGPVFIERLVLFAETTHRILALLAIAAEAAMPHAGEFLAADLLTGQNPGQDQVEDSDLVKHAAGGQAKDRDIADPAAEEHGAGQHR